jgi:restriction system protein
MTVFEVRRHDAAWRIEQLVLTGNDPGARPSQVASSADDITDSGEATEPILDLERVARDRLAQIISQRFAGHPLARLVAAILEADGYTCEVSPPGPDSGVDILAARGPLGLDSPHVVVQVKSGTSPVDAPTLQQLHGALSTHGGQQGLLVAWGGLTNAARQALRTQRFTVRVWDADDLINALCRVYDRLPEDLRSELPLKVVWIPVEDQAG